MRKFIAIMLIFACCMFFGCSQKEQQSSEYILLNVSVDSKGQIIQSLYFSVGSETLKNQGLSQAEILNFKNELIQNIDIFRKEFLLNYLILYTQNPDPKYKLNEAFYISEVRYNASADALGFNMIFNSNAWSFYHKDPSPVKEENSFFNKRSTKAINPFASLVQIDDTQITVGRRYCDAYLSALPSKANIEYNPDLIYCYITPADKIRSNSDYKFQKSGANFHVWKNKLGDIDKDIELYTLSVNYLLIITPILVISIATCSIAISVLLIKNKKKKRL